MSYFQCCPSSWSFSNAVCQKLNLFPSSGIKVSPLIGPLRKKLPHKSSPHEWEPLYLMMEPDPVSETLYLKNLKMMVNVENNSHVDRFFPVWFNTIYSENLIVRYVLCCSALEKVVAYVSLCFSIFHTIAYNTSKCVIAV